MTKSASALDEVREYLSQKELPIAYLATVDADGAPQVRPLTLMFYRDSFYFATFRKSHKAQQISRDKRVEFVTMFHNNPFTGYIRVMGTVQEIPDLPIRLEITTACKYPVTEYWKGVDDPDFLFFKATPARVKYNRPGEFDELDVTEEFPT
jgi:general stress protein 26